MDTTVLVKRKGLRGQLSEGFHQHLAVA